MSRMSKAFIALVVLCGLAVLVQALAHWQQVRFPAFVALLMVSLVASRLRVKLPGITGTMSVNLPFILVAVAILSVAESLLVACLSTLMQCLPRGQKKLNMVQAIFNFCNMALAVAVTRLIFESAAISGRVPSPSLRLAMAAAGFFVVNSVPVAIVISLTENAGMLRTWTGMFQLSLPYYVAAAGTAAAVLTLNGQIGWQAPAAMLPIMLGILHSYRRYFAGALHSADVVPQAHAVPLQDASPDLGGV